jgi:hypothetical protein
MRGRKGLLWAAALAMTGLLMGARPLPRTDTPRCEERCRDTTKECQDVCEKYANPKALKFCSQACERVEKKCLDSCADNKKKSDNDSR